MDLKYSYCNPTLQCNSICYKSYISPVFKNHHRISGPPGFLRFSGLLPLKVMLARGSLCLSPLSRFVALWITHLNMMPPQPQLSGPPESLKPSKHQTIKRHHTQGHKGIPSGCAFRQTVLYLLFRSWPQEVRKHSAVLLKWLKKINN